MTITVPTADVSPGRITRPGRAARPSPQVIDQTGNALAGFGQVMQSLGSGLERQRLDREMERASIDMLRGFSDLRSEISEIRDPIQAGHMWMHGVVELRNSFSDIGDNGRPRVDPANQDRFDHAFDGMLTRQEASLGRSLLLAREQQRQDLAVELESAALSTYASSNDPEEQAAAIDVVTSHLARDVSSGRVTEAEASAAQAAWLDRAETEKALIEVSADDVDAYSFETDAADAVAIGLADDPDLARLARAVGYQPESDAAVAEMQSRIDEFAALSPADRSDYLTRAIEDRGQRRRADIPRPKFLQKPVVDPAGLQDAINLTVDAYRGGRIDMATYAREADHLRQLMETYHG